METRVLIAYVLIGAMIAMAGGWMTWARTRRRARARRMRGIKVEQTRPHDNGRRLAR